MTHSRFVFWLLFGGALLILLAMRFGTAEAQQIPTCTLTAQPATATGSADVTVTWSSTNATTCVASGGWSGPKDCSGGSQVMQDVTQSRTFNMVARAATGKVTAKWSKITTNTDGSPATISGYKLFVNQDEAIPLPATPLEFVFWRPPGNVQAGIKAVRQDGVESNMSAIANKTVTAASGTCTASVTIAPRPKSPTLTLSKLLDWLKGKKPDEAGQT